MEGLGFFLIIVLIVVVSGILASRSAKKRREAWQQAAEELGLPFHQRQDELLHELGDFKLLNRGRSRRLQNVVSGDSGDMKIAMGDYHFTTGSGKNRRRHRQTICALRSQRLQVPRCYLRPQSALFDKIGKLLGGKDFDFPEDAGFSAAYVLQGEDEAAVRGLFDTPVRDWFAARKDRAIHFEAYGGALVFRGRKLIAPSRARQLLGEAIEVHELLAEKTA